MPLYTYSCKQCEHDFEALVFEGDEVHCPQCMSEQLQKQWGVPARVHQQDASLPTACDPSLPPCRPGCCRLPS